MNTKLGVVKGTLSLGSARIIVNLLNALGVGVLARLLTPNDFGIVAIATTILTVVASFTELSLQPALVQCREPTKDHIDTVWTMSLLRALLIFLLFVIAAWPLSLAYGDPRLLPVFIVTGLTGAMYDFSNPRIALSTRYMDFAPLMKYQIYQKLFGLVIATALALLMRNFWAIIIGNAIGAVLCSFLSYRIVPYWPRFTLSRASEIWGFSGWLFLNQICETLNWRFDQLAIGFAVPKTQLGFYAMADNLAVIPSREVVNPISGALFAGIVAAKDKPDGLRSSFVRSQSLMAMITAPLALGLALVARPAVLVILGEQWLSCTIFVEIFALAYLMGAFTSSVRPLAMAAGATRLIFIRQLIVLSFRIPLITAGLIAGGITGVAFARLVSSVMECVVGTAVASQLIRMPLPQIIRIHTHTVIGLAVMIAVLVPIERSDSFIHALPLLAQLVCMIVVGVLAYTGTILLVWRTGGRPDGAVSELLEIIQGLLSSHKFRRAEQ